MVFLVPGKDYLHTPLLVGDSHHLLFLQVLSTKLSLNAHGWMLSSLGHLTIFDGYVDHPQSWSVYGQACQRKTMRFRVVILC